MKTINKNLTNVNFTRMNNKKNKYIVIHYTANNGDTAYGNTKFFKNVNRNASANYFVDENSIWQCVEDKDKAWHCGGKKYKGTNPSHYKICYNSNSIGIEMCSRIDHNSNYYFKQATISNTVELVQYLMRKYNIPIENVIRHYDVTGKQCPRPFLDDAVWEAFKKRLESELETVEEIVQDLSDKGIITDTELWTEKLNSDINCYWLARKSTKLSIRNQVANVSTVNDIVWELWYRHIITNKPLWLKKLSEDINAYWLANKICNKLY